MKILNENNIQILNGEHDKKERQWSGEHDKQILISGEEIMKSTQGVKYFWQKGQILE